MENDLLDNLWLVYHDRDNQDHLNPISALAYEDALIRYIPLINQSNDQSIAAVHFYPYEHPTILLGGRDTRLPQATKGYQYLKSLGYQLAVRPHGGLAVVNDQGVVNISFITDMTQQFISIDDAYEQCYSLLKTIFAPYDLSLSYGEITRSYCPGSYDLILNGQKVGGTAQRRFKNGLATAAYLSLNGDQVKRASILRQFYRIAQADQTYPDIDPTSMTTISEVLGLTYTQQQFERDVLATLSLINKAKPGSLEDLSLVNHYQEQFARLTSRNHQLLD